MEETNYTGLFVSFWWLIFPLMGFVFGGIGMLIQYRRSRDAMELLKTYAAQGKEPPPEVLAAVTGVHPAGGAPYAPNPYAYGYGPWGWGRWGWRGPLWSWSRVVTFAAIAIGFTLSADYIGNAEAARAFHVVATIMGVLAAAFFVVAVMHTLFFRAPKP